MDSQARIRAVVFLTFSFFASISAAMPEIGTYYQLANSFLKEGKVLSLDDKDQLFMEAADANSHRQLWYFTQGWSGSFYMHNLDLGDSKAVDSDNVGPQIKDKGKYTGQYWHFTRDGNWFRISNNYQSSNRVLDTANAPGNYLLFEDRARGTLGTFWQLRPVTSIPSKSTQFTTTTTVITLDAPIETSTKSTSDGTAIVQTAGISVYPPGNSSGGSDDIQVSGCVESDGFSCRNASDMDLAAIVSPCLASNSHILRNKSDPLRYVNPPKLKHNDCQGSHPLSTMTTEFSLVEKFIASSERRFIAALKAAPELVIDFDDEHIRKKLVETRGRVPYTLLEAHVFGDMMNELVHPELRTPESSAALRWLAKGRQAVSLRTWSNAQKLYRQWKSDPCAFRLPDDFPQEFKDDFNRKNKKRDLYGGCGLVNTSAGTLQSNFSIHEVNQGNPEIKEFVKWGGYLTSKDVLINRQESFNETGLSLPAISVISAASVAAAGGIAALIAAATITTTVTFTSAAVGTVSALAAVSAIMPFSGGLVAAASAAGLSVTSAMMGASVFLGPAAIVVIAIVGITAAISLTAVDADFHDAMRNSTPPWDTGFVIERQLESMQADVNDGKGADLLFAFSDAMSVNNSTKTLPFTINIPQKSQLKVTAAWTRGFNGMTYLIYSDGSIAASSANRSTGFDTPAEKMPGGMTIPPSWFKGINAALPYEGGTKGYMWKSGQYLRLNDLRMDAGYPANMPGGWQNMPASWAGNVDAAIHYRPNNKHYFFKGNEYLRLTGVRVDAGYPSQLPGGWVGMPADFVQGIDAATYRGGHVYMIKGDQYIRFTGTRIDTGYPKSMDRWPE